MMFAGMKTKKNQFFSPGVGRKGVSPRLCPRAPAGKLLLCENLLYAGNFIYC